MKSCQNFIEGHDLIDLTSDTECQANPSDSADDSSKTNDVSPQANLYKQVSRPSKPGDAGSQPNSPTPNVNSHPGKTSDGKLHAGDFLKSMPDGTATVGQVTRWLASIEMHLVASHPNWIRHATSTAGVLTSCLSMRCELAWLDGDSSAVLSIGSLSALSSVEV
jgi:hypothetical protein